MVAIFERAWGARVNDPDGLESALQAHTEAARLAFPEVAVEGERFAEHLARRVPKGHDPSAALARLRVPELFLTQACADGDPRAIAAFDKRFLQPAAKALVRGGEDADAVDEALQTLRERLFLTDAKIGSFSGAGSLAAWTRVTLLRQYITLKRSNGKTDALDYDLPNVISAADPEAAAIRLRYGEPFRVAFRDAFAALTRGERNLLRFYFVDGLSLGRIAPLLGVSRATAGRRLLDAQDALLSHILKILEQRLRISRSEIESIVASLQSTLRGPLCELLRSR